MFALRSLPVWLFGAGLLFVSAPGTATLAKPPSHDPPPIDPPTVPAQYQVIWLQPLDGYSTTLANDVNIFGTIVGTVCGGQSGTCRAVRWQNGSYTLQPDDLNQLVQLPSGIELSSAECINSVGWIAGCYQGDGELTGAGGVYVWKPSDGTYWLLDCPGYVSVRDMNIFGTVVGYMDDDAGTRRGFVWKPGQAVQLLPALDWLSAINDWDVVVGILGEGKTGGSGEVFTASTSALSDCHGLGGLAYLLNPYTGRPAISNDGTIAATVALGTPTKKKPMRLRPGGVWEILGEGVDYDWCAVTDMNAQGSICGVLTRDQDTSPGFVFQGETEEFWLLDERIVSDQSGLWMQGEMVPKAIADASSATSFAGFSTIVGWSWRWPGTFVLVPGPAPAP